MTPARSSRSSPSASTPQCNLQCRVPQKGSRMPLSRRLPPCPTKSLLPLPIGAATQLPTAAFSFWPVPFSLAARPVSRKSSQPLHGQNVMLPCAAMLSPFDLLPLQLMSLLLQGSLSPLLPICLLTFWPLKTMPLFATSSQGALIEPSIDGAAERCTPPIIRLSGLPGASQVGPTATALSQAAIFWIPTPF